MNRRPADQLAAVYARIPEVHCQRKCQDYCGPIPMEPVEDQSIFGKPWSYTFEKQPMAFNPVSPLNCPKLARDGNCMVYDLRPTICRLFGVVKRMACPFGCEPDRWLSDDESYEILREVRRISLGNGTSSIAVTADSKPGATIVPTPKD